MARGICAFGSLLCLTASCFGQLAQSEDQPPQGRETPPAARGPDSPHRPDGVAPPTAMPPPPGLSAGPRPLRRLTKAEYENTVRALLRLDTKVESGLPEDERGPGGFDLGGPVGEVDFARLQDVAERLAAAATTPTAITRLVPCSAAMDDACARPFIEKLGRRAFRRPLTTGEVADLHALYTLARKDSKATFAEAIAHVLAAMLQAPQFLYLWETTEPPRTGPGSIVRLSPHEVASRLSYFLTRSMPDDALYDAVDAGRFTTEADVAREARRLLTDPRSRETVVDFHRQWLHLASASGGPLARAADAETAAFVGKVLGTDGKLETLLTSPLNNVNETLAPIYGASGVTGDALREMAVNPQQRFGLLTQVHFLSTHADGRQSHPVKRGAMIFQQLLCGELPPPPDDIPQPKPARDGVSNRQRFAEHGEAACAKGCHAFIDPFGFALEAYDGTARFRTTDGGKAIDARAELVFPSGARKPVDGAGDLVRALVASQETTRCLATQWARYALARREEKADAAGLATAAATFDKSGQDIRELIVAITTTPSFLYRTVATQEGVAP